MKWQQDWEELVCSLQRGRANEESSLREKKGYTIFRDRFDHVSRTFHRSKEHRQAYIRIGLAHDPPFLSYFLRSLLYYYIPRPTVRENQRKCAANKISHVILRSILRSPIHHDRDNASAIRSSWSRDSPRAERRRILEKKKKITEKSPMFRAHCAPHLLLLYPPSLCTMILPLAPPPPSPLPLPCSFLFYIPLVEERVSQGLHPSNAEIRSPPRNDRWRGDTSEWQESRRSTRAGCREYRIENPPIHQAPGKLFLCTAFSRTPSTTLYRYPVINQQQDSKHQRSFVHRLRMTRIDHDTAKIRTREGNARGFFALDHPEEPTEVPLILYAVLSLVLCIRR